ncbi:hypothetical protein BD311DRAFT_776035 [Dichomitus squalens]|uniref:Uncharacterized protein n=1 Tax=Dichomitus squalens TaxID=114155 RepID=A0A4Q9MUV7_9APHY|nr:hypothetical protein BD311DRAFT_776035 [Dichomitus squalens]
MSFTGSATASNTSAFGHVNLMHDTLIANLQLSDMQAITRALLCSSPPEVTAAFVTAVWTRLKKTATACEVPKPVTLFVAAECIDSAWKPSGELGEVLRRSRVLYGAGMGLASLKILTAVVIGAARLGWVPDDEMEDYLAVIDADICQAIVSSKQEIDAGVTNSQEVADVRQGMLDALEDCRAAMQEAFPFERGYMDAKGWRMARRLG